MTARIPVDDAALAHFCRSHGIRRLSLFGSVLRPDFTPQSDVDVLVEFEADKTPGFFGIARLEQGLGAIFGRRVDLRTPQDLSRYFRHDVMEEAETHFATG